MEHITSRKNKILLHLKSLSLDGDYRRQCGEYVCDGETLLREAVAAGAEISCVLWGDGAGIKLSDTIPQYSCPKELMQSVSPLKNSPGPVFSVKIMPPVGAAAVNSPSCAANPNASSASPTAAVAMGAGRRCRCQPPRIAT